MAKRTAQKHILSDVARVECRHIAEWLAGAAAAQKSMAPRGVMAGVCARKSGGINKNSAENIDVAARRAAKKRRESGSVAIAGRSGNALAASSCGGAAMAEWLSKKKIILEAKAASQRSALAGIGKYRV